MKKLTAYLLVTSVIGVISLVVLNRALTQRERIFKAETLQIQVENKKEIAALEVHVAQPQHSGVAGPGIAEPALVSSPDLMPYGTRENPTGPYTPVDFVAVEHPASAPAPDTRPIEPKQVTPVTGYAPRCIPDSIPHLGYHLSQAWEANYQRPYSGLRVSWQYHDQKKPGIPRIVCLHPGAPYQLPYGTVTIHRR